MKFPQDGNDVLHGLSFTEDHFGDPHSAGSVPVDPGEPPHPDLGPRTTSVHRGSNARHARKHRLSILTSAGVLPGTIRPRR